MDLVGKASSRDFGGRPLELSPRLSVQDAKGEPAPDPTDGVMYVITEVAQYSLKDRWSQISTSWHIQSLLPLRFAELRIHGMVLDHVDRVGFIAVPVGTTGWKSHRFRKTHSYYVV